MPRRSLVVAHTWIRGARQLNDLRVQVRRGVLHHAGRHRAVGRGRRVSRGAASNRLSRSYRFPSLTYGSSNDQVGPESRYQFKDTYSITSAQHELKFGADVSLMKYQYDTVGNVAGAYTFSQDQPFNPSDPASIAELDRRRDVRGELSAGDHEASVEVLRRVRAGRLEGRDRT